jgi:arylsulfatase A-like enzyme
LAILFSAPPAAEALARATGKKAPNVLFIPVDDLKPMLAVYGDDTIKTPNIDRLAERGMVFLNNHCQQAVCGPSRASLMTGLYPDTTRIYDLHTKMRDTNPDILTMPQYFRQMG